MKDFQFKKERDSGFTMIEILVSMGIAVVTGALLLVIIVNSAGLYSTQSSKVQEGLNINDALLEIRGSVKQASAIIAQYTNGQTTYTTGPDELVLEVASLNSSGNILSDTYDFYVFYLDQNYLRFRIFPDPASSRIASNKILSNLVDTLSFQYFNSAVPPVEVNPVDATKVRISLKLKQRTGKNFEVSVATSEANLRND